MWYLHSHPSAFMGGFVSLMCEALKPDMADGGLDHSDLFADPRNRAGRSASFYWATVYGSDKVATRITRAVHGYHERVVGDRPDGRPYAANDPDNLRWAHAGWPTAASGVTAFTIRVRWGAPNSTRSPAASPASTLPSVGTDLPATMGEFHDYFVGMTRSSR